MALLSILIPVYNVAPYLAEFLSSCENGLDDRVEIIFCDDASTDLSLEMLQSWQEKQIERGFFGVRIIQNETNQGITPTRERLLRQAQGEYLWFVDSDDILVDGAVRTIICKLTQLEPDVVLFDYQVFDDETRQIKAQEELIFRVSDEKIINQNHTLYQLAIKDNKHYFWNKVFKRTLAQGVEVHAAPVYEDIYYVSAWLFYCQNYLYLNQPLLKYRLRTGSLSHRKDFTQIYAIHAYLDQAKFCVQHIGAGDTYAYLLYKAYTHYYRLRRSLRAKSYTGTSSNQMTSALEEIWAHQLPMSGWKLARLLLKNGMIGKMVKLMLIQIK